VGSQDCDCDLDDSARHGLLKAEKAQLRRHLVRQVCSDNLARRSAVKNLTLRSENNQGSVVAYLCFQWKDLGFLPLFYSASDDDDSPVHHMLIGDKSPVGTHLVRR
jgi:hypothetical protein